MASPAATYPRRRARPEASIHRTVDAAGTDGRPLGGRAVRQRWPRSRSADGVRRAKLVKTPTGGDLTKAGRMMTAVIEVTGLTKRYGGLAVVDDIAFRVDAG